jgi:transposase
MYGGAIMSLQPQTWYLVLEETARVARAAFPKGNPYLRMYEELGVIYTDQQFAALFPQRGQPATSPVRLALATILQFAEGLSDRQAADAVRGRIDWKYLLYLELTDSGFDHTVLSEFRARLIAGKAEAVLLDTLLTHFRERGLLKARGKQRTDSTHVVAAVRSLNRLERVGETLRHALNVLATAAPDWLQSWIPRSWVDQYGPRMDNYRFPKTDSEREALASQIGADGRTLLAQIDASDALSWLADLPAIKTLRQVWTGHYTDPPEPPRWRAVKDLPATTEQIVSPYDTEARWSMKRDVKWAGYKVHLTETCDAGQPRLITHVETTVATVPDDQVVPAIHQALERKALLPQTHLVDAGYTDADLLRNSTTRYGIDLVGPVAADASWQAREQTGFDHTAFQVDWDAQTVTCPQGRTSVQWHVYGFRSSFSPTLADRV